ncbi:MAG: hypothetical protein AAFN74_02145 [Myxococcota bacterium]
MSETAKAKSSVGPLSPHGFDGVKEQAFKVNEATGVFMVNAGLEAIERGMPDDAFLRRQAATALDQISRGLNDLKAALNGQAATPPSRLQATVFSSGEEKDALKAAAADYGESLGTFLMDAALARGDVGLPAPSDKRSAAIAVEAVGDHLEELKRLLGLVAEEA